MSQYELTLTRLLDAPADKLFRCWTTPQLMKQWFAPKPYTTPIVETDLRPGGASKVVMRSPEGQDIPCPGQYLEVVPGPQTGLHRCLCRQLGSVGQCALHGGDHYL